MIRSFFKGDYISQISEFVFIPNSMLRMSFSRELFFKFQNKI